MASTTLDRETDGTVESTDQPTTPDAPVALMANRRTPWQRAGADVSGVTTAAEAMTRAGLDWTVERRPLYRYATNGKPGELIQLNGKFVLTRSDSDDELSVVSDRYVPFQNRDAFEFIDTLIDSGDAEIVNAGSVRGGRVVFMVVKIPSGVTVAGEDRIDLYLLLTTSHDGSSRINIRVTPVRIDCLNQLGIATLKARSTWGVTHTADVRGKVSEARAALKLGFSYVEELVDVGTSLAKLRFTEDDFASLLRGTLEERPKRDDEIAGILATFRDSPNLGNHRETGWGALNAYAEWSEHGRVIRSDQAAFGHLIGGRDMRVRSSLTEQMLARVA